MVNDFLSAAFPWVLMEFLQRLHAVSYLLRKIRKIRENTVYTILAEG